MHILICGSRRFNDYEFFKEKIDRFIFCKKIDEIISGGATGADTLAERYAIENNIPVNVFVADWKGLGKKAGPIRNSQMLEYLLETKGEHLVLAFVDSQCKGTWDMVNKAKKANVPVYTG